MGRLLIVLVAALGGVAVWRRKTLRADADRVTNAAKGAAARARGETVDLGESDIDLTESDEAPADSDATPTDASESAPAETSAPSA